MTDPAPDSTVEDQLDAADAAARRPELIESRLAAVAPMTTERWNELAIDDLTGAEAKAFWQAISE